jgi:5-methylcytosine-specific restriction endonuclease McrA
MDGNGHRRRELRKRVLAEETHCALCDEHVDKTLRMTEGKHGRKCTDPTCTGCVPDPMRAEVDEDIPRIRGGSQYDRANCHLMHRTCNRWKGTMTLAEAKAKRAGVAATTTTPIAASPIW